MSKITRRQLAEVIGKKTLHSEDKKGLANEIAAFLTDANESFDLHSLVRDIMQYRLENGIVEAVAVSANGVDDRVLKDIKDLLKEHFPDAKSIVIDQRIDKAIVGGIRIELPQENLDLSIKSKLNLFKRLVAEENI